MMLLRCCAAVVIIASAVSSARAQDIDLAAGDDERAEYILAATLRFFHEHLRG